jgi:flavin-binding protein dodecin
MADPFLRSDRDSGGLGSVFKRSSVTLEAIESLLAEAECVRDVTPEVVSGVCAERGIDLRRRLQRGRRHLYRRYLRHCFEDMTLSEQESSELEHLRELLHLGPGDVASIHDEVAVEVYGEAVEEVLADFQLDEAEANFLGRLRQELELPEEQAERIYRRTASEARDRAMSQASSRDREFVSERQPAGEFTGRSTQGLEAAIDDALAKATLAVPSLHWFEVTQIAGYVHEGKASGWHVTVQAGIRNDD